VRLAPTAFLAALLLVGGAAVAAGRGAPDRPAEGSAGAESPVGVCPSLRVLARFSGVTDDGLQGGGARKEATSILCTDFGTTNIPVTIHLFQWSGSLVGEGSVTMTPGDSYTFSTQNTTIYFDDVILGPGGGTPAIFQGSGVILSTGGDVLCTAQSLDPLGYPPSFVARLQIDRPSEIFIDGFDGFGDTCEWSSTTP